jgi:ABC-2 type transport system permease protein
MEALMATPVSIVEILLGKLIPYFVLGIGSMMLCLCVATQLYQVPFRGSFLTLLLVSGVFLLCALGQGLFISAASKNQFVASQAAIMSAFLPAFMLSGFIFEISSMPKVIQWLTHIFAARYFVTSLQTLFLAGDVNSLILASIWPMLLISFAFFAATKLKTKKRLDI